MSHPYSVEAVKITIYRNQNVTRYKIKMPSTTVMNAKSLVGGLNFVSSSFIKRSGLKKSEFVRTLKPEDIPQQLSQDSDHMYAEYLWCEAGCNSRYTKIYLDRDVWMGTVEPSKEEKAFHLNWVYLQLKIIMKRLHRGKDSDFEGEYKIATRHGYCHKEKKWKLSFRPYILGFQMRYTEIPRLIEAVAQGDFWDLSVYKESEQLICAINGHKSDIDKRQLVPTDGAPLLDYIVQYVEKNWTIHSEIDHESELPIRQQDTLECIAYEDPQYIRELLECLNSTTASDYTCWVGIGYACRNLGGGGDEFKSDWIKFSFKAALHDDAHECETKWNSLNSKLVSAWVGKVYHHAQLDDPCGCKRAVADRAARASTQLQVQPPSESQVMAPLEVQVQSPSEVQVQSSPHDMTNDKFVTQLITRWEHQFYGIEPNHCQLRFEDGRLLFEIRRDHGQHRILSGFMTQRYMVYLNIDGDTRFLGTFYKAIHVTNRLPDLHGHFLPDTLFEYTQHSETKSILKSSIPGIDVILYHAYTRECEIIVDARGKQPVRVKNPVHVQEVQDAVATNTEQQMSMYFGRGIFIVNHGTIVINNHRGTSSIHSTRNLIETGNVCDVLEREPTTYRETMTVLATEGMSYERKKQLLERFTFKCSDPTAYYTITTTGYIRNSLEQIKGKYMHLTFLNEKGKKKSFIDAWVHDQAIRLYTMVDDVPPPLICPDGTYNLWSGFAIEKNTEADASKGSVDMFLSHLSLLVMGIEAHAIYFTKWLAQIVQEPGKIIGICMVFVSDQGAGKNIFFNGFANIINFDRYFESAKPDQELFDKFSNFNRLGKLLICMDETRKKSTFGNNDVMKNLITSEFLQVEQKGCDTATMRNTNRLAILSNDDVCAKKEKSDRRMVWMRCSDAMAGNNEYFESLAAYFNNIHNQRAIFEFLKAYDIRGTNWIKDRPVTQQTAIVAAYCNSELLKFLESKALKMMTKNEVKSEVNGCDFIRDFKLFCVDGLGQEKVKCSTNSSVIGKDMVEHIGTTDKPTGIEKTYGHEKRVVYKFSLEPFKAYLVSKHLLNDYTLEFAELEEQ